MNTMHYIGFDIHKKTTVFCEKVMYGAIVDQGTMFCFKLSLPQLCEIIVDDHCWLGLNFYKMR